MRTGIVHLEFRMTSSGPSVMEVAVRTPGDYIMELCSLAYGMDWFELVLRLVVGDELPPPPEGPVKFSASLFVVSDPGEVIAVDGLDEVRAHPAVVDVAAKVKAGDTVQRTSSSLQRTGYAVLAADSRKELEEAIEFVRRTLSIKTVPVATEE